MVERELILTGCRFEINIAEILVTNRGVARKFYVDKLGLTVAEEIAPISPLVIRAGNTRLSIFGDGDGMRQIDPIHIRLGTADLERQMEILEARGLQFDGNVVEAAGFCRFVQTHDPFENLIRITEY